MSCSTEDELEPITDEGYAALEEAWVQDCYAKDAVRPAVPVHLALPVALAGVAGLAIWLGKALFHV